MKEIIKPASVHPEFRAGCLFKSQWPFLMAFLGRFFRDRLAHLATEQASFVVLRIKLVHSATETVDFAFFRDRLSYLATEHASFAVLRDKSSHLATETVDFAGFRDKSSHLVTEQAAFAPPSCSWIITSAEPQSIAKVMRTGDNITINFQHIR